MALPHKPGDHALVWNDPNLAAPENFRLTADWAGERGDATAEIPNAYRGRLLGRNLSPAVGWSELPTGTAQLALIVQDPDTPMAGASTHLVALIDPAAVGRLADGDLSAGADVAGIVLGRGSLKRGWAGPLPPKGHGPHRYVFQAYALEHPLALQPEFRLADLRSALSTAPLGRAMLVGTHETR